jgi:hypothetical protein
MTPEPSPLVTIETTVQYVTLDTAWPYMLAFVLILGFAFLLKRRGDRASGR